MLMKLLARLLSRNGPMLVTKVIVEIGVHLLC